jgi:hypothetical protein
MTDMIPKEQSEAVTQRRTDYTMTNMIPKGQSEA